MTIPVLSFILLNLCIIKIRKGKNPVSYATLSVRGSTIRAFLLPDAINVDALLVDDAPKKTSKAGPMTSGGSAGRGRGRGRGRMGSGGGGRGRR
jgi:small nuclear ribonucleoprotein D1